MFDKARVDSFKEEIVNALRPLGVSVPPETIQLAIQDDQLLVMLMGLVREDAASQSLEQRELEKQGQQDLSKMLAEQHRMDLAEQLKQIREMAKDESSLEEALFSGEACEHPHVHPEGFCIDCGEPVDDE